MTGGMGWKGGDGETKEREVKARERGETAKARAGGRASETEREELRGEGGMR